MGPSNHRSKKNGGGSSSAAKKGWSTVANNTNSNSGSRKTASTNKTKATPETAAQLFHQATAQAAMASLASGNREFKVSFGPSRPPSGPGSTSQSAAAAATAAMSFGSLDLASLKQSAAAAMQQQQHQQQRSSGGGGVTIPAAFEGLPCSEVEMKALMGMFVDIMGMSMDEDGNPTTNGKRSASTTNNKSKNSTSTNNSKTATNPMFMFGSNPPTTSTTTTTTTTDASAAGLPPGWPDQESLAAATANIFGDVNAWEALRRTYAYQTGMDYDDDDEDDEDDDDSIPDLDDMREIFGKAVAYTNQQQQQQQQQSQQQQYPTSNATHDRKANTSTTIAPGEWESLEQVAVEDALEAEERARKAAKKREKKQRRKQKQKDEAAQNAVEAAQKKKEKALLSWRSRVVSACQSNEASKLDALLQESPLSKSTTTATATNTMDSSTDSGMADEARTHDPLLPHLEFFIPNIIAKNRNLVERGTDTRYRLATYLLELDANLAVMPLRSGRSPLHSACFQADVGLVELILSRLDDSNKLNSTCEDSGWTPLHYAAVSGSIDVVEALMRAGCQVQTISDDRHTWKESDGKGVSTLELIQHIHKKTYETELESHGVALQEMEHTFFGNQNETRKFLRFLGHVVKRLTDVEDHGYSPPNASPATPATPSGDSDGAADTAINDTQTESASSRKRKKKKKKKQAQKEAAEAAMAGSATNTPPVEDTELEDLTDPLVTALMGMGFAKEQISAAVRACGGTSRATADDLVTWILGQDADGSAVAAPSGSNNGGTERDGFVEVNENTVVKTKVSSETSQAQEEARQKEEAAKRFAAKREEQRRRNREWNNRAQARQQQQVKATAAQAVPAAAPKLVLPKPAPGYVASFPSLQNAAPTAATASTEPTELLNQPDAKSAPISIASSAVGATTGNGPAISILKRQKPPSASQDAFPALSAASSSTKPPPIPTEKRPSSATTAPTISTNSSFPPLEDDKTVSSFGSNRAQSVSSGHFVSNGAANSTIASLSSAVPPPGFMQAPPPGMGTVPGGVSADNDDTTSGEIRATAKAFVPQRPPRPSHSPVPEATTALDLGKPLGVSKNTDVASFDNSGVLPPGFLAGAVPATHSTAPFLATGLSGPFNGIPPVSSMSNPPPTLGSALPVMPGFGDSSLGIQSVALGQDPAPSQGLDSTASLLSSAFTSGPPTDGASLWGTSQAVPALGGLSLAFGDSTLTQKENEAQNSSTGDTSSAPIGGWGAPNGSGLSGGNGGGSIW